MISQGFWFSFCLYLLHINPCICFIDTCSQQTSISPLSTHSAANPSGGTKLPNLPKQFKTNLEINIINKNLTVDAVEYFDYYENFVRLDTMQGGLPGTALYDFSENEAIYISLGVCQVYNLTSRPEILALYGDQTLNGVPHVMDSNYVLKFGSKYGETYLGPDVIRGINVEHWQACVYWPQFQRSYIVDYFFSAPGGWNTPSGFVSVPVRAEARGSGLHHIYDYYSFNPGLENANMFETPPGVICKGRRNTRNLPRLPTQFYYRQEIIYPVPGIVTPIDIWYDEMAHLVRVDYRPLVPGQPTFTTNSLTEIHDFNAGVRYIKDNNLGNCTLLPLLNTSYGASENAAVMKYNGSYSLHMKNPLEIFTLNNNYTYVGKRPCRGLTCFVYSALVNNYQVEGSGNNNNATIEFFFMSDEFQNYPNDGNSGTRLVPVKMTVDIPEIGFHQTSNFMDFDGNKPKMSVFDVSSCYQESEKIQFKVRFEGKFDPVLTDAFEYQARQKLSEVMNVNLMRIQELKLDFDFADVYLHATLVRDTPSSVQFQFVGKSNIQYDDDAVIDNVMLPVQCAELCVTNKGFTCNSFDFCQGQNQCRLSKTHIGDGGPNPVSYSCSHFSRIVSSHGSEITTLSATYATFQTAVYSNKFSVPVYIDNNPVGVYVAVDTFISFGWLTPVQIPPLYQHFSYVQEIVIPGQGAVFNSKVWYDSNYKLTRYDYRSSKSEAPYYSTNPMTVIHDFNTGVQYVIDRFYMNCTISQIHTGSYDSELNMQQRVKEGAYIIQMKNPLDYFHIGKNIRFIGQSNVRGMETSVYESVVRQYTLPGYPGSYTAVLRIYFLVGTWSSSGVDGGVSTKSEPVKLDVVIVEKSLYMSYNLYDFEDWHPDLSLFDTKMCFSPKDQHHFQITFPGPFHPYLDLYSKVFQLEAQEIMSATSGATILRFTENSINYDENNVYLTSTLLERPAYLFDFTQTGNVYPHSGDTSFTLSTASDCADTCVSYSGFACNSFDFCPTTKMCYLSKTHVSDGTSLSNDTTCDHYSRTVNASSLPSPSLWIAYTNLKNAVYLGKLQVQIPSSNNKSRIYTASSIKDTQPKPKELQGGQILQHFLLYRANVKLSSHSSALDTGVAIDDCANACLTEELFTCESFDYCYNDQSCYLSIEHPDANQSLIVPQKYCTIFARQYLDGYTESRGVTYPNVKHAISSISTTSANLCARQCWSTYDCRSFDFCTGDQSCILRSTHVLDSENLTMISSPTCSHYSRNYLNDFRFVSRRSLQFGASLLFEGVSVEQCAKLCIDQEGGSCKTFAYCNGLRKCQLIFSSPRHVPAGSVNFNNECDLYIRQYNPSNNLIPITTTTTTHTLTSTLPSIQNNKPQTASKTSVSIGPVVGTGFGMLVLGIILGIAGSYFLKRHQLKNDDMNMHILDN